MKQMGHAPSIALRLFGTVDSGGGGVGRGAEAKIKANS